MPSMLAKLAQPGMQCTAKEGRAAIQSSSTSPPQVGITQEISNCRAKNSPLEFTAQRMDPVPMGWRVVCTILMVCVAAACVLMWMRREKQRAKVVSERARIRALALEEQRLELEEVMTKEVNTRKDTRMHIRDQCMPPQQCCDAENSIEQQGSHCMKYTQTHERTLAHRTLTHTRIYVCMPLCAIVRVCV